MSEKLPVHEAVKVLKYKNIYLTEKWWKSVVFAESFGKKQILIYQWIHDNKTNKWRRKQKMSVKNRDEWNQIKEVVEEYLGEL